MFNIGRQPLIWYSRVFLDEMRVITPGGEEDIYPTPLHSPPQLNTHLNLRMLARAETIYPNHLHNCTQYCFQCQVFLQNGS